ncbi:Divalent metal cation transporter MntH [Candidatus Nitrosocosmicus oleophilus]|jgi:NRAMP (natural resistance-associated macrophage protein)-like metal ion transporter|uniref:Divalent metal cation transporter MntH n=1 Tax=Candidatus Nitrosocosmicus oleophilus TaxID=1353260 RepID=A0A654LZY8_9ARCH|nr:divalent metal cation transporter [Candidatus Nitrosocosmicus oleophilus]ALI35789.1 Divalent metal cation transporter MntH [Candidatus Nitrosocosmicus oleophilus]
MSIKSFLKSLGPGLITGTADDDPSSIATFAQAGAKFGLGMLWTVIYLIPLIIVIQEICARIGLLTGSGLGTIIKKKYSRKIVLPLISLLLVANTINVGADIGAMAASASLMFPQISLNIFSIFFTAFIIIAIIMIPYKRYIKILKYLTLSLLTYIVTALIVGGNWYQILIATIVPHVEFTADFATMLVAILGTTISPYLFFWQASEEAEEEVVHHKIKEIGKGKPKVSKKEIKSMGTDTMVGIGFAHLITWAIIVTTAGSLHDNGITEIQSAEQAAKSLEPLVQSFPNSGEIAKSIFAIGIIGTGLLSIPVLATSTAYGLSDTFGWKQGLSQKFGQAKAFYLVIIICGIIGLGMNFLGINPITALIYASVINGVVSVPIIFVVMKLSNDKEILKENTNGRLTNIIGWTTFVIMSISTIIMFITFGI